MSTLAQLQAALSAHILHQAPTINEAIVGDARADAATRLAIYAQAYRLRLLEVLQDEHPGLRALLGDEDCEAALRAFIEVRPSPHRNVRWYGAALADFMRQQAFGTQPQASVQMAQLEWTLTLAFDAPDQPLLRIETLATLAPEQWPLLPLRLAPHWHDCALDYNLAAIRLACDQQQTPPELCETTTTRWAIWRRALGVRYRALEADEAELIPQLQAGIDFGGLCEALAAWHPEDEVALRAAGLLRRWVEDEWLLAPEAART